METDSSDPAARTLLNVQNSDGTLVISPDRGSDPISVGAYPAITSATSGDISTHISPDISTRISPDISTHISPDVTPATSPGAALAIDEARRLGKPVLLCNPENLISAHSAFEWIVRERIDVLNIAGPRSSEFSGIYGLTVRFLLTLLGLCAGEEADKSGHEHRQKE